MKNSEKESFNYIFWQVDEYPFVYYAKSVLTREEKYGSMSYFVPSHGQWINNPTYVVSEEEGESLIEKVDKILETYKQKSRRLKEEYKMHIGFLLYSKLEYKKEKEWWLL